MARSSEQTRQRILDAAYLHFRRTGYTRTNMDEIASAADLTKRTLYTHFESKDKLLEAVMEAQSGMAFKSYQSFGRKLTGTPVQIVEGFIDALADWTAKEKFRGSGFTRLAMELADLPGHPARKIAKRHKAIMEDYLAQQLAAAGVVSAKDVAREIWILTEGALALLLIHNDRAYIDAAASAARTLIKNRM